MKQSLNSKTIPESLVASVSVSALSGKAKTDFEDWFVKKEQTTISTSKTIILIFFYSLTETMKNAEIIEFLETKLFQGVSLWLHCFSFYYKYKIEYQSFNDVCLQSIEKANEIYNMQAEH